MNAEAASVCPREARDSGQKRGKQRASSALLTATREKNQRPFLNPKQRSYSPAAPRPSPPVHSVDNPTLYTPAARHTRKKKHVDRLSAQTVNRCRLPFNILELHFKIKCKCRILRHVERIHTHTHTHTHTRHNASLAKKERRLNDYR